MRSGRNIRDGYQRGWGLMAGGLMPKVFHDPAYARSLKLAEGRTIQDDCCRMNLFLIMKFFLPKLAGGGNIIEFGSYRGGSAIFMASVCRELGLDCSVYALDTFTGMPATNDGVDLHRAGDFEDSAYEDLTGFTRRRGLENLTFVKGLFQETAPEVVRQGGPFSLVHIDCDIYDSVAYAYEVVKPHMTPGGYIIFDDCHSATCLGATEAAEELLIRRDVLHAEQVWPHWVFRAPQP